MDLGLMGVAFNPKVSIVCLGYNKHRIKIKIKIKVKTGFHKRQLQVMCFLKATLAFSS